jgi:serine O-acetyltransferase
MKAAATTQTASTAQAFDAIWFDLRAQADMWLLQEPDLHNLVGGAVLQHESLEEALAAHLAGKIGNGIVSARQARSIFIEAFSADNRLGVEVRADLAAVLERDPACESCAQAFVFLKGFHALESYRVAHWLWTHERKVMALYFQNRISDLFAVDIHPAARIGCGVVIDHATGVVIGETAVVGDDVSIFHGVTLGATGKERADRHPKVGRGVLLGADAKVLGNISVGEYSRISAGSVVLHSVPPFVTVAGVPARLIGDARVDETMAKT